MADTLIYDGDVPNDQLTWVAREVPVPMEHALRRVFPDRTILDPTIRLAERVVKNRVAKFRTPDGHFTELARDRAEVRELSFMMLGAKSNESEWEWLQRRFAVYGGTNMQALQNALYNDIESLTNSVHNRLELARGDALADGILTIDEEGVKQTIDFGVPAEHKMVAPKLWSDTTGSYSKLDQLRAAQKVYRETNGFDPAGFIAPADLWSTLLLDPEFRQYYSTAFGQPPMVGEDEARAVLSRYRLPSLLFTYDAQVDVDGVDTRILPADRLIFLPPGGTIGYTAWGICSTAEELVNAPKTDFSWSDAPGIVGMVVKNANPPFSKHTYVDATAMPIIDQPKKILTLKVL